MPGWRGWQIKLAKKMFTARSARGSVRLGGIELVELVELVGLELEQLVGDNVMAAFLPCFGRSLALFALLSVIDVSSLKKTSCLSR
jgi:hypothetical protein